MATVYLYILGSSPDPDGIVGVPWRVDDDEIFFGPCKKRIREELRTMLLDPQTDRAPAREEIHLEGSARSPCSGSRAATGPTAAWEGI